MLIHGMHKAHLRIILEATSEPAAKRVLTRLGALVDMQVNTLSKYHKGGFEGNANILLTSTPWNEAVFHLLHTAQQLGRGWVITGDILEQIDLSCDDFVVAGIEFASITLDRTSS